jgi:membrane protein YqaA with SNARE-associated domain
MGIAFAWGVAEATLFFIVPDVYLGFVALVQWRRSLKAALAAAAGAVLGGTLMYWLAGQNPAGMERMLDAVPLIDAPMIAGVRDSMSAERFLPVFKAPLTGTPYKIYAVQAGALGLPYLTFVAVTALARLERFIPAALAFGVVGRILRPLAEKRAWALAAGYALLWAGVYVSYALVVTGSR